MTRRIRELDGGKEVKIAAMSASGDSMERARVLAENMDDFLRKPYRASDVFECLAQHLGVRYMVSEPAPTLRIETASTVLQPEDFSAVPGKLRAELERAVISLDAARVKAVIAVVAEHDAALAARLSFHVERLAFGPIYSALNVTQEKSAAS
jgi:CheY-like chemotaxis protein